MPRSVFVILFLLFTFHTASAGGYMGNKILEILGEDKDDDAVKDFKAQFSLDKYLKNPVFGIKLTTGHDSGSVITAITFAAAGYELNDVKFRQFESAMPFDISFNDDEERLTQKLGPAKGSPEDVKLKYKKEGITVNVFFKSSARKKIAYIKFTQNIGLTGAYRLDGQHDVPVMLASTEPIIEAVKADKVEVRPATIKVSNKNLNSLPAPATFGKATTTLERTSRDPFYNAIMNVIESGEEEMFKDIKKEAVPKSNFWNYKYTYTTSVAIPGEKYNMLYSFPFQSSQLDFVSVLEETEGASPVIDAKYTEVEAKLKEYFKPSEGWTYHYTANAEDPKGIKDLELKNPKLGSIVLDYSINPYGKHVLYLRFLLQYT